MDSIGKNDSAPLCTNAPIGCFEQLHNAQAHSPVTQRRLALRNTFSEVARDPLERLGGIDIGAPYVARTVSHEKLALRFVAGLAVELYSTIVNLNRFAGVQLIEDQALARPGEYH